MLERTFFEVGDESNKMRLEDFLFEKVPTLSRMYLRELIKTDKCEVNGRYENGGRKLRSKDFVEIEFDPGRSTAMRPENMPLDVVYEDADIIVVNKQAGMLVHPTHRDKSGTLLNALTFYLNDKSFRQGREDMGNRMKTIRPGLVHRLDKQTSGLMLVAKSVSVHRVLAEQFKRKLVEKRYIALVEGSFKDDEGLIEAPIGRFAELKFWNVKYDGKHARTRFWVRHRDSDTSVIELEPVTGRTNQLRIHCASVGHPIVGDVQRGGRQFGRLCLHAFKLSFKHPSMGEALSFELSIPTEFKL